MGIQPRRTSSWWGPRQRSAQDLSYTYFVSADPNWTFDDPPSIDARAFLGDLGLDPLLPYTVTTISASPDEGGVVMVRFVTHLTRPITGDNLLVDWSDNSFTTSGREPAQFGTYVTADRSTTGVWASHAYAQGGTYHVTADLFDNLGQPIIVNLLVTGVKGSRPAILQTAKPVFQFLNRIDLAVRASGPGAGPLVYYWSVIQKPRSGTAAFDDNNDDTAGTTSVTVDRPGDYRFSVVVSTIGSLVRHSDVLVHVRPYAAFPKALRIDSGLT